MRFAADPTEQWRKLTRVTESRLVRFTTALGFDTPTVGQDHFTDHLIWSLPLARELQTQDALMRSFFPYSHHAVIDLRPIAHWGDWANQDSITIFAVGEDIFQLDFKGTCQSLSAGKRVVIRGAAAVVAFLNTCREKLDETYT